MRLFIFGAGFSGRAISRSLAGKTTAVTGTTRSAENFETLAEAGIAPLAFDGSGFGDNVRAELRRTTHLVLSIPPGESGDPVLPLIGPDTKDILPALEWGAYLSTVGVYGNHDGAWVDEDTVCRPVSRRSLARAAAEKRWMEFGTQAEVPTAIIRLSGIYGPGRNTFRNFHKGKARRLIKPGQVFNRIHVADIAGATRLLAARRLGGIFNVTDDEPAPPQDLVMLAAELMGIEPPEPIAFEDADLSPMARSFYGENKRVSNAKIKAAGYTFVYPDYRAGLETMWRSGEW